MSRRNMEYNQTESDILSAIFSSTREFRGGTGLA